MDPIRDLLTEKLSQFGKWKTARKLSPVVIVSWILFLQLLQSYWHLQWQNIQFGFEELANTPRRLKFLEDRLIQVSNPRRCRNVDGERA
jgi:hypothetical protein